MLNIQALFVSAFLLAPSVGLAAAPSQPLTTFNQAYFDWLFVQSAYGGAGGAMPASGDSSGNLNVDCVTGCAGGGGGAITAAPGSYSSGALVDGAIVTLGTQADTAWGLSGSATDIAIQKKIALELNSLSVTANPPSANTGTPSQPTTTCGTSSGTILAANAATVSESFHVPSTAANVVWINVTGATAVTAAPSFDISPGQTVTFTAAQGLLPTSAVTCIASASTSLTVIYK